MSIRLPPQLDASSLTETVAGLGPSQRVISRAVYAEEYASSLRECMQGSPGCEEMVRSHDDHCVKTTTNAALSMLINIARDMKPAHSETFKASTEVDIMSAIQTSVAMDESNPEGIVDALSKCSLEAANESFKACIRIRAIDGGSLLTRVALLSSIR